MSEMLMQYLPEFSWWYQTKMINFNFLQQFFFDFCDITFCNKFWFLNSLYWFATRSCLLKHETGLLHIAVFPYTHYALSLHGFGQRFNSFWLNSLKFSFVKSKIAIWSYIPYFHKKVIELYFINQLKYISLQIVVIYQGGKFFTALKPLLLRITGSGICNKYPTRLDDIYTDIQFLMITCKINGHSSQNGNRTSRRNFDKQ